MTTTLRQALVALRLLAVMTLLLGVAYPVALWAVGRVVAPAAADGSFVTSGAGNVVGSSLIGQAFDGPTWFHPRASAAGQGYDAQSSGGSNLAADNPALLQAIADRKAAIVASDGVAASSLPADAVTASGSGLDPDISPDYAREQVARVAGARGLAVASVSALVDAHVTNRLLGFLGEPRVDVLALNLALEQMG
jgi:K+-transporting ATPase ATPase C chain